MSETTMFEMLSRIDVSSKVEKKGSFNYLSWAWAWAEACKICNPMRKIYKNDSGWSYHTDGKTAWVEVGVIINGVEHIDMLPVMDFKNKAIAVNSISAMDVNKAIQRSTVKALALHGLGLHIYAGEDLPITPQPNPPISDLTALLKWALGEGKTVEQTINQASAKYTLTEAQCTEIKEALTESKEA